MCKLSVKFAVPLGVAAQTNRHPMHHDLKGAADGVALVTRGIHRPPHRLADLPIHTPHVIVAGKRLDLVERHRVSILKACATNLGDVAVDDDAEVTQEGAGDGAGGDTCGCLARAGTFEDIAQILAVVFDPGREIGVPGPGTCHGGATGTGQTLVRGSLDAHRVLPVNPIAVPNQQRDRASESFSAPNTRENFHAVLFNGHPASAAVPQLTTGKVGIDVVGRKRKTGRNTINDHHKRGTV